MIVDTTYPLPLARIDVDVDLFRAIAEKRVKLSFGEIGVSLISLFELQAKAARLAIPAKFVEQAIKAIFAAFRVEPFYLPKIVSLSLEIRRSISDYIDCVIAATAAALRENLLTEDSRLLASRKMLKQRYRIEVLSYRDIIG